MQKFDDESLASKFKLKSAAGALITAVEEKSPAEAAGMKSGDVITGVNGKPVGSPTDLRMTIGNMSPGTKIELLYFRDGEEKNAQVTLAERKVDGRNRTPSIAPPENEPDVLDGIVVGDLDESTRSKYGIPESATGVVVTEVKPDCPSANAGLRVGDVIHSIERTPVKSADQAEKFSATLTSEKEVLLHVSTKGNSRYIVVKDE